MVGIGEVCNPVEPKALTHPIRDKSRKFVLIPSHLDNAITKHYHGETSLYRTSTVKDVQYHRVRTWVKATLVRLVPAMINRLKIEFTSRPILY